MSSLGAVLAALNVDGPPLSLKEAARRLKISTATIGLRQVISATPTSVHQGVPATFPEYFPPELVPTREALEAASHSLGTIAFPDPDGARPEPALVNNARLRLLRLLKLRTVQSDPQASTIVDELLEFYKHVRNRTFDLALDSAEALNDLKVPNPPLQLLTVEDITIAQHRQTIPHSVVIQTDPDGSTEVVSGGILPPYTGPEIDAAGILLFQEFLERGREREFRLHFWRGEIALGAAQPDRAITHFDNARNAVVSPDPRRRLAIFRRGLAHLDRGDIVYQRDRVLDSEAVAEAATEYNLAITDATTAPLASQRQVIENYARTRLEGLSGGLNFLGLPNHHFPPEGLSFRDTSDGGPGLFTLAKNSVVAAQDLRDRFQSYLAAAEKAQEAQDAAHIAASDSELRLQIFAKHVRDASAELQVVSRRTALNRDRLALQKAKLYQDTLKSAVVHIGKFAAGGALTAALNLAGIVTFAVETELAFEELDVQGKENNLRLQLAQSQLSVALIEFAAARARHEFLTGQVDFLDGKRLRTDVYYELALAYERLLDRQLEEAIRRLFLAERRAVFELGVRGADISPIGFTLPQSDAQKLEFPEKVLKAHLNQLNTEFANGSAGHGDFFYKVSLVNQYPLEFAIFRETGRTFFEISAADLDRAHKGRTNQKLRTVKVLIDALTIGESTVLSGHLRHRGTFLLRDANATNADSTKTLLPTEQEMDAMLEAVQKGIGPVIRAGGVTFWQTVPATMPFIPPTVPDTVNELEHYGFSGTWELQLLPEDNPGVNFDTLENVIIEMSGTCVPGDPQTEEKVRDLLKSFQAEKHGDELLDRTAVLSMKQVFPSAFEQLKQGSTSFDLTSQALGQNDIADAKVKAVLVHMSHNADDPVEVKVVKDDVVVLDATIHADGFSEDLKGDILTRPVAERFALEGVWHVEAQSPSGLASLKDVIWFFLYTP